MLWEEVTIACPFEITGTVIEKRPRLATFVVDAFARPINLGKYIIVSTFVQDRKTQRRFLSTQLAM
jgi:hypothetical protein